MTKSGKPTIDDALARRISDALSSDAGLSGDAELSSKLASDKAAGSYAKDLGRIDMWLASWPVPEPSEAHMEALASRIEQRLRDLPTGSVLPFLAPPEFDDDDALRDATAGLLTAGAKAKVPAAKAVIPKPSGIGAGKVEAPKKAIDVPHPGGKPAVAKPLAQPAKPTDAKPIAKVSPKVPLPAAPPAEPAPAVEAKAPVATSEATAPLATEPAPEPTSAATEAEAKPAAPSTAPPAPETSGEYQAISLPPEAAEPVPEVVVPKPPPTVTAKAKDDSKKVKHEAPPKPPKRALGPAAQSSKVDDRISIPMPTPLAPVVQIDAARAAAPEKKKGGGLWPLLAAAAVVGLTVAVGGSFMFADRGAPSASSPIASDELRENELAAEESPPTTTVTSAPAVAAIVPPAPASPAAMPSGGAFAVEAPTASADGLLPTEPAAAEPVTLELLDDRAASGSASTPLTARRARVASGESDGRVDDEGYRPGPGATTSSGAAAGSSASRGEAEGRTSGGLGGATRGGSAGSGGGGSSGGAGTATGSTGTRSSASGSSTPADDGPSGGGRARGGEVVSGGDLPETPSRDAVRDALDGVAPQVYACYGDDHGLAEVTVIVAGSGRVTTCTVSGRFAGTPVGSCIARAVRSARFPAFSQDRFTVNYEYRH